MNHYVYEITDVANNKKYIGKRTCKCSIEKDPYLGRGKIISDLKKKYPRNNFIKKVIEVCNSEEHAYQREKYWIEYFNAVKDSNYYNLIPGGNDYFEQNSKKVICLTTKEFFNSAKEAARKYSIDSSHIIKVCKGKRTFTGRHPITNKCMKWKYYENHSSSF